jgi:hypothetical protein
LIPHSRATAVMSGKTNSLARLSLGCLRASRAYSQRDALPSQRPVVRAPPSRSSQRQFSHLPLAVPNAALLGLSGANSSGTPSRQAGPVRAHVSYVECPFLFTGLSVFHAACPNATHTSFSLGANRGQTGSVHVRGPGCPRTYVPLFMQPNPRAHHCSQKHS